MRRLLSVILSLTLLHLFANSVRAAETAISVSPAILEVVTKIGENNQTKITLTNMTTFPLPIKGQVDAFLSNNKLSDKQMSTFNAASWFTLEPADFILQPMERKDIEITITPPANSEPGGHYATIYFQPLIPREVISHETTVSLARVGILSFLVVPGDIHEELTLDNVTAAKPWQTFGPTEFNLTLTNHGNIHLLPTGKLEIKGLTGKIVETLPLTPNIILPDTNKQHFFNWNRLLVFGRFTAEATINYGSSNTVLVGSAKPIWIIPWPLILGTLALLTLLYNVFIVHLDRVKLAIKVLKGNEIHETKDPQKNSRLSSGRDRRSNSPNSSFKRSRRRQSH
jgi:hypothetical protein